MSSIDRYLGGYEAQAKKALRRNVSLAAGGAVLALALGLFSGYLPKICPLSNASGAIKRLTYVGGPAFGSALLAMGCMGLFAAMRKPLFERMGLTVRDLEEALEGVGEEINERLMRFCRRLSAKEKRRILSEMRNTDKLNILADHGAFPRDYVERHIATQNRNRRVALITIGCVIVALAVLATATALSVHFNPMENAPTWAKQCVYLGTPALGVALIGTVAGIAYVKLRQDPLEPYRYMEMARYKNRALERLAPRLTYKQWERVIDTCHLNTDFPDVRNLGGKAFVRNSLLYDKRHMGGRSRYSYMETRDFYLWEQKNSDRRIVACMCVALAIVGVAAFCVTHFVPLEGLKPWEAYSIQVSAPVILAALLILGFGTYRQISRKWHFEPRMFMEEEITSSKMQTLREQDWLALFGSDYDVRGLSRLDSRSYAHHLNLALYRGVISEERYRACQHADERQCFIAQGRFKTWQRTTLQKKSLRIAGVATLVLTAIGLTLLNHFASLPNLGGLTARLAKGSIAIGAGALLAGLGTLLYFYTRKKPHRDDLDLDEVLRSPGGELPYLNKAQWQEILNRIQEDYLRGLPYEQILRRLAIGGGAAYKKALRTLTLNERFAKAAHKLIPKPYKPTLKTNRLERYLEAYEEHYKIIQQRRLMIAITTILGIGILIGGCIGMHQLNLHHPLTKCLVEIASPSLIGSTVLAVGWISGSELRTNRYKELHNETHVQRLLDSLEDETTTWSELLFKRFIGRLSTRDWLAIYNRMNQIYARCCDGNGQGNIEEILARPNTEREELEWPPGARETLLPKLHAQIETLMMYGENKAIGMLQKAIKTGDVSPAFANLLAHRFDVPTEMNMWMPEFATMAEPMRSLAIRRGLNNPEVRRKLVMQINKFFTQFPAEITLSAEPYAPKESLEKRFAQALASEQFDWNEVIFTSNDKRLIGCKLYPLRQAQLAFLRNL